MLPAKARFEFDLKKGGEDGYGRLPPDIDKA
jgi:hypothetical protein